MIFALPTTLFAGTALFVYAGIELFSRGWESYEEKYVRGAEGTLAALYLSFRPQHLLYLSVLVFFLFGAVCLLSFSLWSVAFICGAIGFWLPRLTILLMKRRREIQFVKLLPGAIDAVGRGLRSGLSLTQCLQLIEREMPNPISQEFRVMNQQIHLGMPPVEALAKLKERMPSEDLDLLVSAVRVAQELGGNLTDVLDNIAATIRERFILDGKIKALTSQGRLQAMVLSAMPFLVFGALLVVNPVLMRPMYTTPFGITMLFGIIGWEALGFFFLWKIVAIRT